MNMFKRIVWIACLLVPSLGWGQSKLSPYTAQFLQACQESKTVAGAARLKSMGIQRAPEARTQISVFVHLNRAEDVELLRERGIKVGTVAGNIVTARIPLEEIRSLASLEEVQYVEVGTPLRARMNEAKKSVKADLVQSGSELSKAYNGEGVVVGIIDTGFEYGHVNFWNKDRTELRIKRVWNQNLSGTSPEPFGYGTEYTTQADILEALMDTRESTHGSHVAGIAAGAMKTDDGTDYQGTAPGAEIVLVSLNLEEMTNGNTATVIDGIRYIYDYATSVGKPCVVNMSLGAHLGPHDGTSAFDQMTDEMQGPGRLLVGSVGNEGDLKFHVSKTFSAEKPDTLKSFPLFVYDTYQVSELEIWGEKGTDFTFIPVIYDINSKKVVSELHEASVSSLLSGEVEYEFMQETDGLGGRMVVGGEINPDNDKPHVFVSMYLHKNDNYRIGFHITSKQAGSVHVWTDNFYSFLSNFGEEGYQDGNTDCTMGEVGGTGKRIVSVGAYLSRDYRMNYGIYYPSTYGALHELANFSSHGPTADGRLKPEIAAPGAYIVSSLSSYYGGSKSRETSITWNGKKHEVGYMAGTSMASPLVAGVLATWMQAYPQLTPEQAKSVLAQTAWSDAFTGEIPSAGSNSWGYGKLDAWAGLKACIQLSTGIADAQAAPSAPLVRLSGRTLHVLFTATAGSEASIRVYNVAGKPVMARSVPQTAAGQEITCDLSALSPGVYLVQVADGSSLSQTQKIIIQ